MTPSPTSKQLDRIENALIGNGQEGLLARTARIEERLKTTAELAEAATETAKDAAHDANDVLGKLVASISILEKTVKDHIGTDHLSVLMKKKEFWAIIIIGFISLHLISTYLPNVWDWIMILVGLPKLVLPIH